MKNLQRYLVTLVILTGELIFLSGCQEKIKKDKVPVLYTTEVRDISNSTATCGGTISNDGGSEVTERGVCISTQSFPTTADNVTINEETGTGSFTNDVTGLTANTKYYVRAYATNKPGTSYGNQQSFTTTNNYLLTGTVTDQVTKQPVAGATVYFAGLPFNEEDETLVKIGPYSRSGEDGRYKIFVPVSSFDWVVIRQSTLYPRIYAEKTGYAGSDYPVPDPGVESAITLYHPARLSLRVWNDTITDKIISPNWEPKKVDGIDFGIKGSYACYPGFIGKVNMMGEPAVKTHCQGRNFDKTFEFYPLWGNVRYYLTVYQNPYISGSSYWNFEIKPKPDSTTIYTISF